MERSRRRDGSTKGGGKALGFLSAKGGCGATTHRLPRGRRAGPA